MRGEGWIRFEGYDGRLDPQYAGNYTSAGLRYPHVERTRTWDIVRVEGEPQDGVYGSGQFTILSRGHDMMKKAHEEAAAYRLHFKRCAGVGLCQDIGHPGGPKRSMAQALSKPLGTVAEPAPLVDRRPAAAQEPPSVAASRDHDAVTDASDWTGALDAFGPVTTRVVDVGVKLLVVPLRFELWQGPKLTMAEDCNKRGGRVVGDQGELSCAEVEIVKRLRVAGWGAAWVQSFKCGRKSWGSFIADLADLPDAVRAIQRVAGEAGGHPDVLAWRGNRVIALESKGPSDSLKASQIAWFARAVEAGIQSGDIGVVEWRPKVSTSRDRPEPRMLEPAAGNRLEEAVAYALELHARQTRKSTRIPYISHLFAVCALVLEDGGTEDEAIAALLHDGPEDQGGEETLDDIRRRFGPEVAALVDGLSDTLESPKPPWRERKEAYLIRLRGESESVLRISLADKLHNLRSMATDLELVGDELWARFNADRESQAWYFRELRSIFSDLIPSSRSLVEFDRLVAAIFSD